ncbi:hypothetical protein T261_0146 [Streptomyces lydicus]|nr:hypothetical protein T261_0146 [Streptomyces lydicus]
MSADGQRPGEARAPESNFSARFIGLAQRHDLDPRPDPVQAAERHRVLQDLHVYQLPDG